MGRVEQQLYRLIATTSILPIFKDVYGTDFCSIVHLASVMLYYPNGDISISIVLIMLFTLSLGDDREQTAAVLPAREEVSVAVLSSCEDSGDTRHRSLSEADSLDNSRASKAEERSPMWRKQNHKT